MAAFLHSQAALSGWDFAQLCPQGEERERHPKGSGGARRKPGTEWDGKWSTKP